MNRANRVDSDSFEKYMHAFASIISMEKQGCKLLSDGTKACVIGEENGWDPIVYFDVYQKLLAVMESEAVQNHELQQFIQRQKKVANHLNYFQSSMQPHATAHINEIRRLVKNPGDCILYPWGTNDHQVYVDIWHKKPDEFVVKIFDLGAGRSGESAVRKNYKPIEHIFYSNQEFVDFINRLVTAQNAAIMDEAAFKEQFDRDYNRYLQRNNVLYNQADYDAEFEAAHDRAYETAAINFYSGIYGASREICQDCVPERRQTTGNCVVKNLLAATKQDAIDLYGEAKGLTIFRAFYLELLYACLSKAKENARHFLDQPLPPMTQVCEYIQASQTSFTGVSCNEITARISTLYAQVSQQAVKVAGTQSRQVERVSSPMWRRSDRLREAANRRDDYFRPRP